MPVEVVFNRGNIRRRRMQSGGLDFSDCIVFASVVAVVSVERLG